MAKPICIIKIDERVVDVSGKGLAFDTLMDIFVPKFPDYHVLAFPAMIDDMIEVQVFHEKDFTEIQYNELKELILKSINEIKNEKR